MTKRGGDGCRKRDASIAALRRLALLEAEVADLKAPPGVYASNSLPSSPIFRRPGR
jgi:hypothetical protein